MKTTIEEYIKILEQWKDNPKKWVLMVRTEDHHVKCNYSPLEIIGNWLERSEYYLKEKSGPEYWSTLEDWNGDYAPSNPQSFEAWATGKVLYGSENPPKKPFLIEFKCVKGTQFANKHDFEYEIDDRCGNRWLEYKEPELRPYDKEHPPKDGYLRNKETGEQIYFNWSETNGDVDPVFWIVNSDVTQFLLWPEFALKDWVHCVDGSPCGYKSGE